MRPIRACAGALPPPLFRGIRRRPDSALSFQLVLMAIINAAATTATMNHSLVLVISSNMAGFSPQPRALIAVRVTLCRASANYHLGPMRIFWYLARYHAITISDAASGIPHRIERIAAAGGRNGGIFVACSNRG